MKPKNKKNKRLPIAIVISTALLFCTLSPFPLSFAANGATPDGNHTLSEIFPGDIK